MSAGGYNGDRHQLSSAAGHNQMHLMRGNFGNTPAGLMSHGQQCMQHDAHRQNLHVSGWNLDDHATSRDHQS